MFKIPDVAPIFVKVIYQSVQLLSNMLDFVARLSENIKGINKTSGKWLDIVEVRLPHTTSFET